MVKNGAARLFRVGGVDVMIHWSWLVILYVFWTISSAEFKSPLWVGLDVGLYIAMVTLHEVVTIIVGRMVGGHVTEMTISFLGRGSNLELPQRPWPVIATSGSGILAYLIMLSGTGAFFFHAYIHGAAGPEAGRLSLNLFGINVILLAWTAAPIYPLAGGMVLMALLWLFLSRKRALQVVCILGLPASLAVLCLAIYLNYVLFIVAAAMMIWQCINGFRVAKAFDFLDRLPRRTDVACPHCRQNPHAFTSIRCPCGEDLEPFETRGMCPSCGSSTTLMACPFCSQRSAIHLWFGPSSGFEVQNPGAPAVQTVTATAATPQLPGPKEPRG